MTRSAPAPAAGAMRAPGDAVSKQEAAAEDRAARESELSAARRAAPSAAREFEHSASAWLERIVRLRADGRHAEADAELTRFRARYPAIDIPRAALPPDGASGTR